MRIFFVSVVLLFLTFVVFLQKKPIYEYTSSNFITFKTDDVHAISNKSVFGTRLLGSVFLKPN
jgi:hypothetical protein